LFRTFIVVTALLLAIPPLCAQVVNDGATNTLANITNSFTGDVTVGTNGSFTLLVISNNALLTNSANGVIALNLTARSNEVRLVSASARWRMGGSLFVGSNGSMNRLVVSNGAFVDNGVGNIGNRVESSNNFALVTGAGSRWSNRLDLRVGTGGSGNQLIVSNGGWVASQSGFVGNNVTSSNNFALVTGSGSVWSNAINLEVGLSGSGNRLVIEAGGLAHGDAGTVGHLTISSDNEALVTGPSSLWTNRSFLTVGDQGGFNRLVVSNSAAVWSGNGLIGNVPSATNNQVLVTGAGSVWRNQNDLTVGNFGPANRLVVSSGGTVSASNLFIGFTSSSTNNRLTVDGGTLRVTNAAGTGVLGVRRGTNVLNAGLIEVDQLLMTNSAGRFDFNGGTLFARSSVVNSGQPFRVGNGFNPATFNLAGNGTHSFGNGLIISGGGLLLGNGTLSGALSVESGGILAPGASIGKIILNSLPLLQGSIVMEISKNGSVFTNDQIQLAANLIYGGTLTVSNAGPDALTVGNRFPLFSAGSYSGSFSTLILPPLSPGLVWTNKLLVDGSIEVIVATPPTVQTLPASGIAGDAATLNGVANPRGSHTTAWFEFGTSTNYGSVTSPQALGNGVSNTNFSAVVNGLVGGVTYHVRAVASNIMGVAFGTNQSFALPVFGDIGAGLPPTLGPAVWGDYDNDGRLDIFFFGEVWRNTVVGFSNSANLPIGFVPFIGSEVLGDYDNDGRLDVLFTGFDGNFFFNSLVLRNTSSGFTNINAGLTPVHHGSVAWGDYDNDGRRDILLAGGSDLFNFDENVAQVWRTTGNTGIPFLDINGGFGLPGINTGSASWADYDNDGRLDILLTGTTNGEAASLTEVWRNTGNGFTNIDAGLPRAYYSSVAWGDHDNDGRLDILLTGITNALFVEPVPLISQVWRNTGTGFTNINAGLPGIANGSAAWGDYDNDGRLDILLAGSAAVIFEGGFPVFTNFICQVWRNTGNGFTNINAGLPGVVQGSAAWGDYDNDGRLDILRTGGTNQQGGNPISPISQVWRNRTPVTNTPPTAPSGLAATLAGGTVILSWNAASDAQTAANGLTYNVRIGTTPGSSDLMGPMSSASGLRRLPQMGNVQQARFRFSASLPFGQPIYWSVQAVDTAFAGSAFAPEQRITFNTVFTPTNGIPVPGDANADGIVSESEFAVVLTNLNGNGIVSQSELDLVLSNYFPHSPFLQMTNVAGLGGTNVTFALSNSFVGAFSVEFTTNLVDWYFLGPATPRYLFTDTNAPAQAQRYYRLRWP